MGYQVPMSTATELKAIEIQIKDLMERKEMLLNTEVEELNLYKLSQVINSGYDTYDECIVAEVSEEDAKLWHPSGFHIDKFNEQTWAESKRVKAELIGTCAKPCKRGTVFCASFNAG